MGNVMSGIAEALVATGVGLFVALPAVVAYNVVQRRRISEIERQRAASAEAAPRRGSRPASANWRRQLHCAAEARRSGAATECDGERAMGEKPISAGGEEP